MYIAASMLIRRRLTPHVGTSPVRLNVRRFNGDRERNKPARPNGDRHNADFNTLYIYVVFVFIMDVIVCVFALEIGLDHS